MIFAVLFGSRCNIPLMCNVVLSALSVLNSCNALDALTRPSSLSHMCERIGAAVLGGSVSKYVDI